jgi:hypothetical protein
MARRGEQGGEQDSARGVPPSPALFPTNSHSQQQYGRTPSEARQLQVALRLADEDRWAALFAARVDSP